MSKTTRLLVALTLCGLLACQANAASISIIGPSPYLTADDVPDSFIQAGGSGAAGLQDFESMEGPWEVGFTFDVGRRIGPNHASGAGPVSDSVDGDDGSIDGSGLMGSSWYVPNRNATITFDIPVRAAGFVLTDADPQATTFVLEARGESGTLLIQQTFQFDEEYMDNAINGTTAEDRFFGVVSPTSLEAIKSISMAINAGAGIELDHVRHFAVPEPATAGLLLTGFTGLLLRRRRA